MITATSLEDRVDAFVGRSYGRFQSWDAVNAPMIRQWREAINAGNDDSRVDPVVAPRTMLNVWMMRGLGNVRPFDSAGDDPYELAGLLREAGFKGVVATRCRQDYGRELRAGERLSSAVMVDCISGLKQTRLGAGYFVTLRHAYLVGEEPVGAMLFTTFHYVQGLSGTPTRLPQPGISADTRFFWVGLAADRLLAQRCNACGVVRHPPGPVCARCHSLAWSAIELSGGGALFSWTVVHHAAHPAFRYPHAIGLVALDEGPRMIAPLDDVPLDALTAGMRLHVKFRHADGEDRLPSFRPATG
jgi:uncharacterized OB-fold protein